MYLKEVGVFGLHAGYQKQCWISKTILLRVQINLKNLLASVLITRAGRRRVLKWAPFVFLFDFRAYADWFAGPS